MNCYYIPATKIVHVEFTLYSRNSLIQGALQPIVNIPEKYRPSIEVTSMAFLTPASASTFQPTNYEKVNIPANGNLTLNNFIYGTGNIKLLYVNFQYVNG